MLAIKRAANRLVSKFGVGKRLLRFFRVQNLRPYLDSQGWFRSAEQRMPVDRDGECLPWYTYGMIRFLSERIKSDMQVFEFGSGNSTRWWSKRVASVTSCEHDRGWYDLLKSQLPENVTYIHRELIPGGDYSKVLLDDSNAYDCIIVDGRDRVNCIKNTLQSLKDNGVVIWDNSDRDKYQEGYQYLVDQGFRRLDFWGLGPINSDQWCTSVFYRDSNCLNI